MSIGKIDKIRGVFQRQIRAAMRDVELELRRDGKENQANAFSAYVYRIAGEGTSLSMYERLEVSDIIRGHKRAWPEENVK